MNQTRLSLYTMSVEKEDKVYFEDLKRYLACVDRLSKVEPYDWSSHHILLQLSIALSDAIRAQDTASGRSVWLY